MNASSPEASDTLMPEDETIVENVVKTEVETQVEAHAAVPAAETPEEVAVSSDGEIEDAEEEVEKPIKPALPAKPEKFAEGDYVVYPTHGVGKVERIATEEIAGHKLELIHITFEENRMTLRVPVAKARSAGLRKLATRKLFDDALAVLKAAPASSGRCGHAAPRNTRRRSTRVTRWRSPRWCAICTAIPASRTRASASAKFTRRRWTRLAAELAALDKTDKMTAATKLNDFLKTL